MSRCSLNRLASAPATPQQVLNSDASHLLQTIKATAVRSPGRIPPATVHLDPTLSSMHLARAQAGLHATSHHRSAAAARLTTVRVPPAAHSNRIGSISLVTAECILSASASSHRAIEIAACTQVLNIKHWWLLSACRQRLQQRANCPVTGNLLGQAGGCLACDDFWYAQTSRSLAALTRTPCYITSAGTTYSAVNPQSQQAAAQHDHISNQDRQGQGCCGWCPGSRCSNYGSALVSPGPTQTSS